MSFDNSYCLFLLVLLLPLAASVLYSWRAYANFQQSAKMQLFLHRSDLPSWKMRILASLVSFLAISCIIFGLAEPYLMLPRQEMKYEGVRIFFLMDVSGSMKYAEDIKPNRLVAVRNEVTTFLKNLDGSYEISIIPFAGVANPYYCPLTTSRSVYLPLMAIVNTESAPALGTDITAAFEVIKKVVKKKLDTGVNVIFLITDGGKEESDATNRFKLMRDITELSDKNCIVNVIGVGGTKVTTLIWRDEKGAFIDFIRENNQPATSQLDEDILKQIASAGKGNYLHFEAGSELSIFLDEIFKKNRVAGIENIVYDKVSIQCYLYALSVIIFYLCWSFNGKYFRSTR